MPFPCRSNSLLVNSGSLSSFSQTTADFLIEHRKLSLPLRPWEIVTFVDQATLVSSPLDRIVRVPNSSRYLIL